ncbi:NAD(P)H-binding protein [Bdellovibrio sp. SKB1291214]|uniref:NAD-dependent epimerase/dehydratase family protein n=1 Tax=Bdellovibrio sp. SKB1291214 TaxID=1732569 RepID=UPI000B51CD65|nr:NAD(P)H-binding protein [Bdellovibrio sp. SKB1291214]UYL09659.1 NAD(P)H-binding protein [Bdellovibrio sp. SKB1291214]
MKKKTALVLGVSGGIGGEIAKALIADGWVVKGLVRKENEKLAERVEFIIGDALNAADVLNAAKGVDAIIHAVNPPGYKNWSQLVLPMIDNTIAAAKATGARIVLPGTIYNFGHKAPSNITETTPQEPTTRKGQIRKELENRLFEASRHGVRVLIVRCGDFFGPKPGNNWFSQGMITPNQPVTKIANPSKSGVGHSWAYLPDAANTVVELLNQGSRLQAFEVFNFGGTWDHDGMQMALAINQNLQKPAVIKPAPWFLFKLLSPFVVVFRELLEMKYLWTKPYKLDNSKLIGFLGHEPKTPLVEAVHDTLVGLGCLPAERSAQGRPVG